MTIPTNTQANGLLAALGYLALLLVFGGAMVARTLAVETALWQQQPQVSVVVYICGVGFVAACGLMAALGYRVVPRFGNHELAIISLVAAMHFAVSLLSRVAGTALSAVLGPYAVFISGVGDEGIPCLLLAVAVVLIPRVGTMMLSILTVFLLNVLFTGTLGVTAVVFVALSVLLHEGMLAGLGVTTGSARQFAEPKLRPGVVARVAVGIALANAGTLYAQFSLFRVLYRLFLAEWYIAAVVLVAGLLYGGIGAAVGAWLGQRLRRVATS